MQPSYKIEEIGGGILVCTGKEHTFGTDSFLLADFAAPKRRDAACDLCSGCGIIPLLWMRGQDAPRVAYALDIQPEAVRQMRRSVELSGLEGRLVPLLGDLRTPHPDLPASSLDLVTANPPYYAVQTGFLSQAESDRAARHEIFCTVDDICAAAARLLRHGGRLCLCYPPQRLADVLEAMRRHRLEPKRLRFVQKRADTAPWLFLVEGKLGAKPSLRVAPPLSLYHAEGGLATEIARIYSENGKGERV